MSSDALLTNDMIEIPRGELSPSPSNGAVDTIGGRFEQMVSVAPNAPAIITDNATLTFRELHALAGSIAGHLRNTSSGNRPVAILMEKGPLPVATMLGVSMAGRVFVPLEHPAPEQWHQRVVASSTASTILTDGAWHGVAKRIAVEGVNVSNVEELGEQDMSSIVLVPPDSPACLFFTSGSTGRPKGVVQGHRGLVHSNSFRATALGFGPMDRVAHLRSFGYSAGVKDVFLVLFSGACLFPFDLRARGLAHLARWLDEERITGLMMASSLFRTWLASLPEGRRFTALKRIAAAAEPLYGTDITRAGRHLTGDWRIVHGLASTETGMFANVVYTASTPVAPGILPVGHVVSDTDVRIEKIDGTPAQVGESGEIIVESRYLALGYWDDPALTQAAFRNHPDDPSRRSYRTGDLGRFRADGTLEHLGRHNRKIKLRGYSVEPYEIECALLGLPDVRDAVVIVVGEAPDARVVGYVVGPKGNSPDQAIRTQLAERLPAHLVPAQIVVLDAMPLTARGKIDRAALSQPPDPGPQRNVGFRAPANDHEHRLTAIWQRVLKIEKLGVDDDFYELGGTSLQAFLIFARITAEFSHDLPPAVMLEAPTIAKQAELLRNPANASPALVPFRRMGALAPLFVVHARFGDIMFVKEIVRDLKSDRPVYGFQPLSLDGARRIPRNIEGIAAHYLADLRKVQPKGPYHLAGYSWGGHLALEMAQQLIRHGESVAFLGLIDSTYKITYDVPGEAASARFKRHFSALWRHGTSHYVLRRINKTLIYRLEVIRKAMLNSPNNLRLWLHSPVPYVQRADFYRYLHSAASARYIVTPYSAGPIHMFASRGRSKEQQEAWSAIASGGLIVREIPAGHYEMVWPPHSATLAAALDEFLNHISD